MRSSLRSFLLLAVLSIGCVAAQTDAAAAALHDSRGCARSPATDANGVLELRPAAPYRLFGTWQPDLYTTAAPRPFMVSYSVQQSRSCPRSPFLPRSAAEWASEHPSTTGVETLRLVDGSFVVVYDHPGIVDGAHGTLLEVVRTDIELMTTPRARAERPGMDPDATLDVRALDRESLDLNGDDVADVVIADPTGVELILNGTVRPDRVDLSLLDPDVCVRANLEAGGDHYTARQDPAARDCDWDSWIILGHGNDVFVGGDATDRVYDHVGGLVADLRGGDDQLQMDTRIPLADSRHAPPSPDVPRTIRGGSGNDLIISTYGRNDVRGGPGDDRIRTGRHPDLIFGGDGSDLIYGDDRTDVVHGGRGDDTIVDEQYPTWIPPRLRGNDRLFGGPGNDSIVGHFGADRMFGGPGKDHLHAIGTRPRLVGGPGPDILTSYHTRPTMLGGPGNDYLRPRRLLGGVVSGGPGQDVFHVNIERKRGEKALGPHVRATRFSCGPGDDRVWTSPILPKDCERMQYCDSRAEVGACGRLPFGNPRLGDYPDLGDVGYRGPVAP